MTTTIPIIVAVKYIGKGLSNSRNNARDEDDEDTAEPHLYLYLREK
jgi:hypothetical protein